MITTIRWPPRCTIRHRMTTITANVKHPHTHTRRWVWPIEPSTGDGGWPKFKTATDVSSNLHCGRGRQRHDRHLKQHANPCLCKKGCSYLRHLKVGRAPSKDRPVKTLWQRNKDRKKKSQTKKTHPHNCVPVEMPPFISLKKNKKSQICWFTKKTHPTQVRTCGNASFNEPRDL